MAATHYFVGVLILAVVVNGIRDMAPVYDFGQDSAGWKAIDMEKLRPLMESMMKNPYLCEVCKDVVGFLKNVTEDNTTLDALVQLLLPLCDWAPYALHQQCITCVEGLPALVKELADKYLNAQEDCAFLCKKTLASETDANTLMNNLMQMMKAKRIN